ncbi:MAG: hypothetical protein MUD12_08345 [Spirochaetes bacterium]|nr:hypothetical protein [Spirochaetota bacterium]
MPKNDVKTETEEKKEEAVKDRLKNVNIDAKMLYGQYNNISSAFSIMQSFNSFSYQLNSDFKRSNDFGYKNSSFYKSDIGFTGKADVSEAWKITPEAEINNDTYGMFRNILYRKEEKDKVIGSIKSEYKPMPSKLDMGVSVSQYNDKYESAYTSSTNSNNFFKVNGNLGWEYLWSASNKIKLDVKASQYKFSSNVDDNTDVYTELVGGFKMAEYFMLEIGPTLSWNRDANYFPSGRVNFSSVGLKVFSFELSYKYDLLPYKPENFYNSQKFYLQNFRLHPGKDHLASLKIGIDYKNTSTRDVYLKGFKLKASGEFERDSKYYNYYFYLYNMLSSQTIASMFARGKGEIGFNIALYGSELEFGANYEYVYYYADKKITYMPVHTVAGVIKYRVNRFELEMKNTFRNNMYGDPYFITRMDSAVYCSLSMQFKVLETFFLYAKADNLLDYKYSSRKGFPDQGRTFLGGLRIII